MKVKDKRNRFLETEDCRNREEESKVCRLGSRLKQLRKVYRSLSSMRSSREDDMGKG